MIGTVGHSAVVISAFVAVGAVADGGMAAGADGVGEAGVGASDSDGAGVGDGVGLFGIGRLIGIAPGGTALILRPTFIPTRRGSFLYVLQTTAFGAATIEPRLSARDYL